MPIYEYHCSKCGDFETMQRMSDKPLVSCPTCRRRVTKLISSTTFHLKGSGWYITDYARKGDGKAEKKGDDTKPEATTAPTSNEGSASDGGKPDAPAKKSKSSDKSAGKKSEKAAVA